MTKLSDAAISYAHAIIEGRIEIAQDDGDAATVQHLERQVNDVVGGKLTGDEIDDLIQAIDDTFDDDEVRDIRRELESIRS